MMGAVRAFLRRRPDLAVLMAVSYLPTIIAGWGRTNADTKLYLTEDAAGLMTRAVKAWDPSQFGGFVPHQAIAYLWPSGPFYWVFDALGAPQWLIQRLWVGTLFLAGSTGVAALLRWLGHSRAACVTAAIFFQASPYVLAYQSRTSSMLLPFAAVGWLSYLSARGVRSTSWLWPSMTALVMFTVGSVNATATLMILPAPVLVALHASGGLRRWRAVGAFALRAGVLSVATAVWWIVMLAIQARHGAQLLTYSETLESVASTSNAFEVLRGFGYWLNYVGLDADPLTSAARTIIDSPPLLVAGTVLPLLALAGMVTARHELRRLSAWLVAVGAVLAVGVHPLDDPLTIFSVLADHPTSTPTLALRSSTRALPVVLVGLAIGLAALLDHPRWRNPRTKTGMPRVHVGARSVLFALVLALVVLANPTKWTNGTVEPTLERSPVPGSWRALGRELDDLLGTDGRVLQFPGQEFGAHTWGHTIDPVLPAVSGVALLTRDLVPLGNETMTDVVWETDEAIRQGRLSPASLSEIARYLHSNAALFPGDLDNERYSTPTQGLVMSANGLDAATAIVGGTNHRLASFDGVAMQRLSGGHVVLLGDGKGLVDAATAGAARGHSIVLAGHVPQSGLARTVARSRGIIVTDTNTEHAQQWRTSVGTSGFDEDREGFLRNFFEDPSDIRMRTFPANRAADKTWFEQSGPVRARVSSYGPPLAYRPEHRAYAAIDGDPRTAWEVSHGERPSAPVIQLLTQTPVERVAFLQPQDSPNRVITRISVSEDAITWSSHELGAASLTTGQLIELDAPATSVVVRIDEVRTVREPAPGEELSGVGFSEIDTFGGPTVEVGMLPSRGLEHVSQGTPLTYVMTRRRAPVGVAERSDTETRWAREFFVPDRRTMHLEVRIDTTEMTAPERDTAIATLRTSPLVRLDGSPVPIDQVDASRDDVIVARTAPREFTAGAHLIETVAGPTIDQMVVTDGAIAPAVALPAPRVVSSSATVRSLSIPACPEGCWLEFGQGWNTGWQATCTGCSLGAPQIMNGGSMGWWITSDDATTVTLRFAPQRWLTVALLFSLLAVISCLGIVAVSWRRMRGHDAHPLAEGRGGAPRQPERRLHFAHLVSTALVTYLVADPWVAAALTLAVGVALWTHRVRTAMVVAHLWLTTAVLASLWEVLDDRPALDFAWPNATNASHRTIITALVVLAALTLPAVDSPNPDQGSGLR